MILQDGKRLKRPLFWRGLDYFWGIFPALSALLLVVAGWQAIYESFGAMILPEPLTVFRRIGEILQGVELKEVLNTLWRGLLAVILAIGLGMILGFIAGLHRTLAILCRPIMTLLIGMPPIIWVVLALFWFGMGDASVIFTVWIVVLPLVFSAAQNSLLSVPNELIEVLKVYRLGFWRKIRYLYVPHIIRHILPAWIVAMGSGLKVTIMAELLGSGTGMGSAIASARAMLDTVDVMAYVVLIVSAIMLIEYGILEPIRRYFVVER